MYSLILNLFFWWKFCQKLIEIKKILKRNICNLKEDNIWRFSVLVLDHGKRKEEEYHVQFSLFKNLYVFLWGEKFYLVYKTYS